MLFDKLYKLMTSFFLLFIFRILGRSFITEDEFVLKMHKFYFLKNVRFISFKYDHFGINDTIFQNVQYKLIIIFFFRIEFFPRNN